MMIAYFIVMFFLCVVTMVVQSKISQLSSPYFGAIIPMCIVFVAIWSHIELNMSVTYNTSWIFFVFFLWSLDEWYKGRKKRKKRLQDEMRQMKARDL